MFNRLRSAWLAALAFVVACGEAALTQPSDDVATNDGGLEAAARDASLNECGGSTTLTFVGVAHSPGDSCGSCGGGVLACSGANALACVGSPVCVDAASSNACGGFGMLTFGALPAAPGQSCGPCNDGTLICGTDASLVCVDALEASACSDGGDDSGNETSFDAGPPCVIPNGAYATPAPPTPTLPPEITPGDTSWTPIPLVTNELVFNPYDGLIYASVPSAEGADGNSIAKIDPMTSTVVASQYLGSEPDSMSLSDDGQALWVALDGDNTIHKLDPATLADEPASTIRPDHQVIDIGIIPGTHDSLMVEMTGSPPFSLTIYDNGAPRPHVAVGISPATLVPTHSPGVAIWSTSSEEIFPICVNAQGSFALAPIEVPALFFDGRVFVDGALYGLRGGRFDMTTSAYAQLSAPNLPSAVTVDPTTQRAFYTAQNFPELDVTAVDITTGSELGSAKVADTGYAAGLVRWGRYGLAFRNVADRFSSKPSSSITIVRTPLIPEEP